MGEKKGGKGGGGGGGKWVLTFLLLDVNGWGRGGVERLPVGMEVDGRKYKYLNRESRAVSSIRK